MSKRKILGRGRAGRRSFDRGMMTLAFTSSVAALAWSSAALAQDNSSTGESGVTNDGTIVVRGTREFFRPTDATSAVKFDLPIQDTPQAISVLTNDLLDTFDTQDILGVSKFVAGVNSSGTGANTNFFIGQMQARGFVLDQLSGFKINGFSTLREFQPDFVAIERVEFLKGPSSVVFGVNNYGGTVNSQLKSALKEFGGAFDGDISAHGSVRVSADLTGPIDSDGAIRFRVATAYDDRKSEKDGFSFRRIPVFGRLEWDLGTDTTFDSYVFWQDEKAVDDFGYMAELNANGDVVEPFGVPRSVMLGDPDYNRIYRESIQGFAGLRHNFSDRFHAQLRGGYTETTNGYRAMYGYTYGLFNSPFVDVYTQTDDRNIKSWDAELTFGGDFDMMGQEHTFLILGEYRNVKYDFTRFPFDNIGSVNQYDPDFTPLHANLRPEILGTSNGVYNEKQTRYALGGQVLLRFTDRLSLLLGGRFDWVSQDVVDIKFDPDPDDEVFFETRNLQSSAKHSNFTKRAGLVYEFVDNVNAYVSYSEGFLPQEGITRGGSTIDPEKGYQWEGGLKGEFLGGKLGASLAGFYIKRGKVAIPDPSNVVELEEDFRIQGGEQVHKGFEFELVGEVAKGLNLVATYAYLTTKITKEAAGLSFGDSSLGNPVIGAPKHSASLFAEYTIPEGAFEHFSLSAGATYLGKRPSQQQNIKAGCCSDGFPIFDLSEYAVVDLGVRYFGLENWVFSLNLNNAFNEDYFNPAQLDADCCSANFLQRGAGRELKLGISYRFGSVRD